MTDIVLDNTRDIKLEDGKLDLTRTRAEDARQRTEIRLNTYQGEWVFNPAAGLPYFQQILRKGTDKGVVDTLFKDAILQDPDIERITRFNSNITNRGSYELLFEALTLDGDLVKYESVITP